MNKLTKTVLFHLLAQYSAYIVKLQD